MGYTSFIQSTTIENFIANVNKESIKYSPKPNSTDILYIPAVTMRVVGDDGKEQEISVPKAFSAKIHECKTADNVFHATLCTEGVTEYDKDGKVVVNGVCPICSRVNSGWDIYRHRMALEEQSCTLVGEAREDYMKKFKKRALGERKAQEAKPYIYILVACFKTDSNNKPIMDKSGKPSYDLKIMKMSAKRVEKLNTQFKQSGIDNIAGSEISFTYPDIDDVSMMIGQSTLAIRYGENCLTSKYPDLKKMIDEEAEKFAWTDLDSTFKELKVLPTVEAQRQMDTAFKDWDTYKEELATNPEAKYLEYVGCAKGSAPSLESGQNSKPQGLPFGMDVNQVFSGAQSVSGVPTMPQQAQQAQQAQAQPQQPKQAQSQPQQPQSQPTQSQPQQPQLGFGNIFNA